jgi:hypothetical protein
MKRVQKFVVPEMRRSRNQVAHLSIMEDRRPPRSGVTAADSHPRRRR